MLKKNQQIPLFITDLNQEGLGIGRYDGFVVMVAKTAIGDRILAQIVKVCKHYAYGVVKQAVEPSPYREEPQCPAFGKCGGCQLQHVTLQAELDWKRKRVSDCFTRLGEIEAPVSAIANTQQVYHYRNKAQYPLAVQNGEVVCGFYAGRSHRVVPQNDCLLQPECFAEIVDATLAYVNQYHISVYDEDTGQGLVRNLYIRAAEETGEIMVCLVVSDVSIPHMKSWVKTLCRLNTSIVSIYLNENSKKTNVILGKEYQLLYGKKRITDRLCGLEVQLSPASFYQVNHAQTQVLYRLAKEAALGEENKLLLDLYCGAGIIGLSMADCFTRVVGVEVVKKAVEDAKENAMRNGIANASFLCADAKEAARQLQAKGLHPDAVVLDPPRKGCAADVLQAICDMAPQRLVMISCNPATAARDCNLLAQRGYEVRSITPVNLFPRTCHVESVVLMSRAKD